MAALSSIVMGGAALAGGIAGAKGQKKTSTQTSGMNLAPESALEALGGQVSQEQLQGLRQLLGAGPGEQDVAAGTSAGRDLASMLQQYAQGGFMPGESDIQAAQKFAGGAFAGQQAALSQQFQDQQTEARRMAAQLNRPINDPILQAKLAQSQMRQQQLLEGEKTSLATQFAQQLPGQRLGFAQQRAELLGGLASQALANRSNLLSLGSQLQAQGQNFRMNTAERYGTSTSKEGGGLMGALSGAIGGASLGAGTEKLFGDTKITDLFNRSGAGLQMPNFGQGLSAATQTPGFGMSAGLAQPSSANMFAGPNPFTQPSRLSSMAPSSAPSVSGGRTNWFNNAGVRGAWGQ